MDVCFSDVTDRVLDLVRDAECGPFDAASLTSQRTLARPGWCWKPVRFSCPGSVLLFCGDVVLRGCFGGIQKDDFVSARTGRITLLQQHRFLSIFLSQPDCFPLLRFIKIWAVSMVRFFKPFRSPRSAVSTATSATKGSMNHLAAFFQLITFAKHLLEQMCRKISSIIIRFVQSFSHLTRC